MSNRKRKLLIITLTLTVILFSTYVFRVVLTREDFRAIDLITIGFTVLAVIKDIQLIYLEVKHNGRK